MKILEVIKKKSGISFYDLCNALELPPNAVKKQMAELREQGYNIEVDPDQKIVIADTIPIQKPIKIDVSGHYGKWIRFGAIGDTHLASKYARLDVLNALYDIYKKEGIKDVYVAGNWIDGEAPFNKYDLHCIGIENQINYFLTHYPQRRGITTHILSGDKVFVS